MFYPPASFSSLMILTISIHASTECWSARGTTNRPVALVTGGNRGIGFELSRILSQRGYHVILTARDPKKGAAALRRLRAAGASNTEVWPLDVGDPASVKSIHARLSSTPTKLSVLVNNAAVSPRSNRRMTRKEIDDVLKVNVRGMRHLTDLLLAENLEPGARVVFATSDMARAAESKLELTRSNLDLNAVDRIVSQEAARLEGKRAHWPHPAYNLSKAAISAYARIYARQRPDLVINAVSPGWCKTEMGGSGAQYSATHGAERFADAALLPTDGPRGKVYYSDQTLPSTAIDAGGLTRTNTRKKKGRSFFKRLFLRK